MKEWFYASAEDQAAWIDFERRAMTKDSQIHFTALNSKYCPAVAEVPSGPVATAAGAIADRLLRRALTHMPLRVVYPDGTVIGAGDATAPALMIDQPDRLARRLGRHGLVGFGESYMAGEWESTDLVALLTVMAPTLRNQLGRRLDWLSPIIPASQRPSSQPRCDIAAHYDERSSDLFAEFLDETMTYSSALFRRLPATWPDLARAQRDKIDRVLDAAGVGGGTRLLEIGTGWGELCIRAAARGAHVRSVTPSARQHWLARQRAAAAGRSDSVRIDLCDYRDIDGCYDAVISVEMVEAVGYRSWPDYLRTLERLVKPGGPVVIQSVTMPHAEMLAARNCQTWTQKYIFPGGLIPSGKALLDIAQRRTNLRPVGIVSLREHYAETLRLWRERFMQRRITLGHIGFDEVFARMWELHLAHREAGFRSGRLNVYQWTFTHEAVTGCRARSAQSDNCRR